jgi:hypothetical protein
VSIGSHDGMSTVNDMPKQCINWEGIKEYVGNFNMKCDKFQKNKTSQLHIRIPLTVTEISSVVFDKCVSYLWVCQAK